MATSGSKPAADSTLVPQPTQLQGQDKAPSLDSASDNGGQDDSVDTLGLHSADLPKRGGAHDDSASMSTLGLVPQPTQLQGQDKAPSLDSASDNGGQDDSIDTLGIQSADLPKRGDAHDDSALMSTLEITKGKNHHPDDAGDINTLSLFGDEEEDQGDAPNVTPVGAFHVSGSSTSPAPLAASVQNTPSLTAPSNGNNDVEATAYLVEEMEEQDAPKATVIKTYCGIERKRLMILCGIFAALAITLGCVLGISQKRNPNEDASSQARVCGPLCGVGYENNDVDVPNIPNPNKMVFGASCNDWNKNSTTTLLTEGGANATTSISDTCSNQFKSTAYACGCPNIDLPPPTRTCGALCTDGSPLPNPSLMVKDIKNREMSCQDWQTESQFELDGNECVNYNVIGQLCGCPNNEPHPDACGTLCQGGEEAQHSELHPVWNTRCGDWNTMSKFLPSWYHNDDEETCQEYYQDVAYGCACPGVTTPPPVCGKLCQDRRICDPICQDGSVPPSPNHIARQNTCADWELASRTEVHSELCPLYHVSGAMCGCDNDPPVDACGPLCHDNEIPDGTKEVHGQTCEDWDYSARFLPITYGLFRDGYGGIQRSCNEYFDKIAYACGCDGFEPPAGGCGTLCSDGSSVPDPTVIVSGRTCGDIQINSLFELDLNQCSLYKLLSVQCGCPGTEEDQHYVEEDCFDIDHIQNKTYYYSSGIFLYLISFGENGMFIAIDNNNNFYTLGRFHGIEDGVAKFGGGAPCGAYGPRTGLVAIVEDESMMEPTLSYLIEPSVCVYKAELRVPKICHK